MYINPSNNYSTEFQCHTLFSARSLSYSTAEQYGIHSLNSKRLLTINNTRVSSGGPRHPRSYPTIRAPQMYRNQPHVHVN